MDDLILRLKDSKSGCCLIGVYYGCLVYANDMLLLAHSVQAMLDVMYVILSQLTMI